MKFAALTSAALICSLALAPAASAQTTQGRATKGHEEGRRSGGRPGSPVAGAHQGADAASRQRDGLYRGHQGHAKVVGNEIQNVHKVKNISTAPIVGLRIDEYFYAGQKEAAIGQRPAAHGPGPGRDRGDATAALWQAGDHRQPAACSSQANGQVKPTAVKKFTEDKK